MYYRIFFLRKFRNKRFGRASIKQLFDIYFGSYSMAVMIDNVPANLFWEKKLKLMGVKLKNEKHRGDGIDGISYEFSVPKKLKKKPLF